MAEWEDYYQILQVHYLAEQDVIESAYRRLCRKYHPDVNPSPDAEERMKRINRAYEVISDPSTRKQYFLRWVEKNSGLKGYGGKAASAPEKAAEPAPVNDLTNGLMAQYMGFLAKKDYDRAYALLCEKDKKNIPIKDFIRWQHKVSEVFELRKFECTIQKVHRNITVQSSAYMMLAEFRVKVVEMNTVMGRLEEDEFLKSVVYENHRWHVYLGYRELKTTIIRFDELASLKKFKLSEKHRVERIMHIDHISGLLNKTGFDERAEREQERRNRYGSNFTLVLCEMDRSIGWQGTRYNTVRIAGKAMSACLRKLDICCRWKGTKFLILLPETHLAPARQAARKLYKAVREQLGAQNGASVSMSFVIAQQTADSLDELVTMVEGLMKKAKKQQQKEVFITH